MRNATNATDIKAALLERIKELPACVNEKWQVSWGFVRVPQRTWVYLGEINYDSSEWVTNRSREETFSVKLVLNVRRIRGTVEDVEREVMRVGSEIESMVTNDPGLGVSEVVTSGFIPKRMDSWPTDENVEAQYEAEVRVTARFRMI